MRAAGTTVPGNLAYVCFLATQFSAVSQLQVPCLAQIKVFGRKFRAMPEAPIGQAAMNAMISIIRPATRFVQGRIAATLMEMRDA